MSGESYDLTQPEDRDALRLIVLLRFIKTCDAAGLDWIAELTKTDY